MHHPAHKSLKAAYSFYNIHTETPLLDLMNDALIIAKLVSDSLLFVLCVPPDICAKYIKYLTVFYILLWNLKYFLLLTISQRKNFNKIVF